MFIFVSMNNDQALKTAIKHFGSQEKLAKKLGLCSMAITQWKKRGVPANKCLQIEQATDGLVTCYELRPDIFPKPEKAA